MLAIFVLQCSKDDVNEKMRQVNELMKAVHISNPKTAEFQVCEA